MASRTTKPKTAVSRHTQAQSVDLGGLRASLNRTDIDKALPDDTWDVVTRFIHQPEPVRSEGDLCVTCGVLVPKVSFDNLVPTCVTHRKRKFQDPDLRKKS